MDDKNLDLSEASPSVQIHLNILQGVVQRMSTNSASCKTWCITLVAGILVVVADKGKPQLVLLAGLPIVLFAALDVYYLALEKGFRDSYDDFVRKLHLKTLTGSDLYSVNPTGTLWSLHLKAAKSFSIWGFYIPLLLMAALAARVVAHGSLAGT